MPLTPKIQKSFNPLKALTLIILLMTATHLYSQTSDIVSPQAFAHDIRLLEKTLKTLHPSIYRYRSKEQVNEAFVELINQTNPLSKEAAYLKLTKFASDFKCSHTHTNPWNQNQKIKDITSEKADKLPFAWRFFAEKRSSPNKHQGLRFYVDYSAAINETLVKGTEILAINGIPISVLMDKLRSYVPADGINPVKIDYQLSWRQGQKYQWFDILLPLLAPPKLISDNQWQYSLTVLNASKNAEIQVMGLSAREREQRLAEKYQFAPKTDEERWKAKLIEDAHDKHVMAYLKLETFATWKMSLDWKAWLEKQFQAFAIANADKLILDIRGNEGGMYEVAEYLYPYLIKKSVTINNFQQKVRYKVVPEELRPYLQTWNPDIYNISAQVGKKLGNFWLLNTDEVKTFEPNGKNNFKQVLVLTDGANSSATFIMSRALKQSGQATLVGETLGGNAKGQTGGQMFFLKLPNTEISIDVPLIQFFDKNATNSVLTPDVLVSNSFEDWMNSHDRILQTAIDM